MESIIVITVTLACMLGGVVIVYNMYAPVRNKELMEESYNTGYYEELCTAEPKLDISEPTFEIVRLLEESRDEMVELIKSCDTVTDLDELEGTTLPYHYAFCLGRFSFDDGISNPWMKRASVDYTLWDNGLSDEPVEVLIVNISLSRHAHIFHEVEGDVFTQDEKALLLENILSTRSKLESTFSELETELKTRNSQEKRDKLTSLYGVSNE